MCKCIDSSTRGGGERQGWERKLDGVGEEEENRRSITEGERRVPVHPLPLYMHTQTTRRAEKHKDILLASAVKMWIGICLDDAPFILVH